MSAHFVYIVRCHDGTLYTGYTTDIWRRIKSHNAGRGARYCARRLPVRLVYLLPCRNRTEALVLESALKRLRRASKLKLAAACSVPDPP